MGGVGGMRGGGGGETSIINFITLPLRRFALYYTLLILYYWTNIKF
jgi:hypothetical protein